MRKTPSEMEIAPRYKLLVACLRSSYYLYFLNCLNSDIYAYGILIGKRYLNGLLSKKGVGRGMDLWVIPL